METNVPQKTNQLAIASLVCGIVSVFFCCSYGSPFNIAALVLGFIALSQIKQDPTQGGKGLAIGGIATGAFSFILYLMYLVFWILFGFSSTMMQL